MEQEQQTNIAALLKDCPKGAKLYSPAYGEVELLEETIDMPIMVADKYGNKSSFNFYGGISSHGECLLFPSKEVRDWGCFRVKYIWGGKGILNSVRVKKALLDNGGTDLSDAWACGDPMTLYYINAITHEICVSCTESEKDYILSTGTELKLGEKQPKFKVGDVVKDKFNELLVIANPPFYENSEQFSITLKNVSTEVPATLEEIDKWNKETLEPNHLHYSKSKRKIIHWFVEYDRVVVKDDDEDNMWKSRQFDYYHLFPDEKRPYHCQDDMYYKQCLPYNENTAKLIGTTDDYTEEE